MMGMHLWAIAERIEIANLSIALSDMRDALGKVTAQHDALLAIVQEYRHIIEDMGQWELGAARYKIDGKWTECSQRDDFLAEIDAVLAKAKGD